MCRRRLALLIVTLPLSACSADVAQQPEPTLETSGAFTAVEDDEGRYELIRTLTVLGEGDADDVLFVIRYQDHADDFDAARRLARDPALRVLSPLSLIGKRYILDRTWRVVWFRSLTEEEQSSFR